MVRIVDPPDVIRRKFKTAVTDSGREVRHDPATKPGISNLIEIMSVVDRRVARGRRGALRRLGLRRRSRRTSAEAVVALFAPIQERYRESAADEESSGACSRRRREGPRGVAPTLETMYERMGFVRRVEPDLGRSDAATSSEAQLSRDSPGSSPSRSSPA